MEANEERRVNKLVIPAIIISFLVTILFLLLYFIKNRTYITPKASSLNSASQISFTNSYIFASPVRAKANGDLIRITIFVLDDQGRGIFGKKVTLGNNNESIIVNNLQSLTDEVGKATFDVSSSATGVFFIEALVDDELLPQKVKVTFD